MGDLSAKTPLNGMAPLTIGSTTLSEVDLGVLTSLAPFKSHSDAAAAALQSAHGLSWPAPGRAAGKAGARAIWFGRDMILLAGPEPDPSLALHMALTDQSDAWVCVQLSGTGAEAVLARLVPIDLNVSSFKRGHTARSMVGHMHGSITRTGPQSFVIMVFRSMAQTLLHDLQRAMESIASRG